jgi:hypothetical protein
MVVLSTSGKAGEMVRLCRQPNRAVSLYEDADLVGGIFICFDPAVSSSAFVLGLPCEDWEPCRT